MRATRIAMAAAAAAFAISASVGRTGGDRATPAAVAPAAGTAPIPLYQGTGWTAERRADFYATGQGSEIMPLSWAKALTTADGAPFLGDRLTRYGYLPNGPTAELPVGFTGDKRGGIAYLGMTCAACHNPRDSGEWGQIPPRRRPGALGLPVFFARPRCGRRRHARDDAAFRRFADRVLPPGASAADRDALRGDVADWYRRQHALFSRALPSDPWGIGRLDAVSMILNRVSGLDIGTQPDGLITSNIAAADAPVRYPFIWGAPKQDRTQWPGFASNGDSLLAIARNLGEVYGVFAYFHPVKSDGLIGWDFRSRNSADFNGLGKLEGLVRNMSAPAWPWPIDSIAADRGRHVFVRECSGCHAERPGTQRLVPLSTTWETPLLDVGTDTRQYQVLARSGKTGVLKGARYGLNHHLEPTDSEFNILAAAVVGSMADCFLHVCLDPKHLTAPQRLARPPKRSDVKTELNETYHVDEVATAAARRTHQFEARVLHGIWATAPYLHNGSVASLTELLTPPEMRKVSFPVGPAYDLNTVGLADTQPGPLHLRRTTGCDRLDSGNSRCGHPYGTTMLAGDKRDLIEFLKGY